MSHHGLDPFFHSAPKIFAIVFFGFLSLKFTPPESFNWNFKWYTVCVMQLRKFSVDPSADIVYEENFNHGNQGFMLCLTANCSFGSFYAAFGVYPPPPPPPPPSPRLRMKQVHSPITCHASGNAHFIEIRHTSYITQRVVFTLLAHF